MTAALPARLLAYAKERFPLAPTFLTASFLAGAGDLFAQGGDGPLVVDVGTLISLYTVLALLFLLRVCDEHKDLDVDAAAWPDRPVQRGLVGLPELFAVAGVAVAAAVVANGLRSLAALGGVVLLLVALGLLWRELFVGAWLREHPFVYLATHQPIVPAFVLYAACARGASASSAGALALLCCMATCASAAFEVGRKVRAPDEERPHAESYSAAVGSARAAVIALALSCAAFAFAATLGASLSLPVGFFVAIALGLVFATAPFVRFALHPSRARSRMLMYAAAATTLWSYGPLLVALAWSRGLSLHGGPP